jgi:magnesium transporter
MRHNGSVIIDAAVYLDGVRHQDDTATLAEALTTTTAPGRTVAWIGLWEPTADELADVAHRYGLHPLAVEDAVHAHQRPKVERYGDSWFIVLKTARYVDSSEVVNLGELMLFVGERFVVTVRHGAATELASLRTELEADPARLGLGPFAIVHAILDRVVDGYAAVTTAVDVDIDQIQSQVFSGDRRNHAERIFRLKREVLEFRQAVQPLADALEEFSGRRAFGAVPVDLHEYFRDVIDHVRRVADRIAAHDALLSDALDANVASVGMRQNEDMRKISAWVAIVSVPTMIAGIYGMNFEHMPELQSRWAYPVVLAVMVGACTLLHRNFKRRGWL